MSILLYILLLKFFLTTQAHPLETLLESDVRRDLAGLFGDGVLEPSEDSPTTTLQVYPTSLFNSNTLGGITLSETTALRGTTTIAVAATAHSIIGKIPSLSPISATPRTPITTTPTSSATDAPPVAAGSPPEAPSTPPAEATEWKVIGLVVICITFVATVILSVVFFDSWWGFLRDLVLGKRNKGGVEDMVPDWDKRTWEFKLAKEDGHRYPTITSLEDIVKEVSLKEPTFCSIVPPLRTPHETESPHATYLPNHDPHPLEPLVRRPSTRLLRSPRTIA